MSWIWRQVLTQQYLDTWITILLSTCSQGAARLLIASEGAPFPDAATLLRYLRPVHRVKKYGLYLKLAFPRDPKSNLPVLAYVGSATGWLGLHGRMLSHFSAMRTGKW